MRQIEDELTEGSRGPDLRTRAGLDRPPGELGWRRGGKPKTMMKLPLAFVAMIAATGSVTLAAEDNPTIEELLKTGWQIAGYSQAFDNRSTFILFRNPDQPYLVQCRVGYDVTRTPSTYTLCYKLH